MRLYSNAGGIEDQRDRVGVHILKVFPKQPLGLLFGGFHFRSLNYGRDD